MRLLRKVCVYFFDHRMARIIGTKTSRKTCIYTDTRGTSAIDLQIRTHFRPVPIHSRDLRFL